MRRLLSTLCTFSLAHMLIGCNHMPPPPTYPHEDERYSSPHVTLTGIENDLPAPLMLMPGDTIDVRTISAETTVYPGLVVDSEGKVHVPTIGAVRVASLAPQQAERAIEAVLQKIDRFARVNVLVSAWGGHTATVIGAVAAEGTKPVTPGMRLAEFVAVAGGPLRTSATEVNYVADLDGARLMRDGKELPVSLRLALVGDPRHNIFVRAGDELFVPAGLGNRIAVLGEDGRGGAMLVYRPGIRLTEALASGGGLSFSSDEEDIRIIRGPLKSPIVYRYDFDKLIAGKTGDVELAPGDVVFVSRHWSATLNEVIGKIAPVLALALGLANTYLLVQNLEYTRKIRVIQQQNN